MRILWLAWLYFGKRVNSTIDEPVSGGSFHYAYDGIDKSSDFVA